MDIVIAAIAWASTGVALAITVVVRTRRAILRMEARNAALLNSIGRGRAK